MFGTMKELVEAAGSGTIADAAKREQAGGNIAEIPAQVERMGRALEVMRASSEEGAQPDLRSLSGLTGGGASKLFAHAGRAASGPVMGRAIARALAGNPSLILADEPTGNLDSKTGADVMRLFHELHEAGNTIVLITHDANIAAQTPRAIHIHDGRVLEPASESEVVI